MQGAGSGCVRISPATSAASARGVRPQRGRFSIQAGYIVWGSKGGMPLDRGAPILPGVFREAVRKADNHHMIGKPTDLIRQLVRICEEGGRILDPLAGSGTPLVGAAAEGYEWLGIEMTSATSTWLDPVLVSPKPGQPRQC